jgi:hypothetical protein
VTIRTVDPFDLPEWLGTDDVVWSSTAGLDEGPRVHGEFRNDADGRLGFDLLAVDAAYPLVSCPEAERHDAHQSWRFGEVLILEVEGRPAAGVPASEFDPNLACEAMRRVARAVGAEAGRFSVSLSL